MTYLSAHFTRAFRLGWETIPAKGMAERHTHVYLGFVRLFIV